MKQAVTVWALFLLFFHPSQSMAAPRFPGLCPFQKKQAQKLFSSKLLHQLTYDEVAALFLEKEAHYGPCQKLSKVEENWEVQTKDAILPLELTLDKKGKIEDFAFGPPEVIDDSLEKVLSFGKKAFPLFSVYVEEDGKEILSLEKEAALNVGRSSQLFLLEALRKQVAAGKTRADAALPLDGALKRLGFGPLQQWPDGTLLSVDTLKALMLIEFDTIAADHLLRHVGRGAVEAEGLRLKPFLFYQEYHALLAEGKDQKPHAGAEALLAAAKDALGRRGDAEAIPGDPALTSRLGWFATTAELCRALQGLKESALAKTPSSEGTAQRLSDAWKEVVSVQAREPGLAQSTMRLRSRKNGRVYCLSVTANGSQEVAEGAFSDVSDRMLGLLFERL